MNLSAIHKGYCFSGALHRVVCDIGGYEFVSYSQGIGSLMSYSRSCL